MCTFLYRVVLREHDTISRGMTVLEFEPCASLELNNIYPATKVTQ